MSKVQESPPEHLFDLSGGALCLDFANTIGDRPSGLNERLTSYSDLLSWGRQAGAIGTEEAEKLERRAGRHKGDAKQIIDDAIWPPPAGRHREISPPSTIPSPESSPIAPSSRGRMDSNGSGPARRPPSTACSGRSSSRPPSF